MAQLQILRIKFFKKIIDSKITSWKIGK